MHSNILPTLILIALLLVPLAAPAQQATEPISDPTPQSGALEIVVLQGEGARNNIRTKTAVQPVVEVRDESGKPVAGAEVVFQLPAAGPGGVFHGWMRMQTARTDGQGQAGTSGFAPNDQVGRFNIKVTATMGNKSGSVIIAQINTRNGAGGQMRSGKSGWWKILAVAGAGALAGGIVAATRNGDSATPANPVTITPGSVAVSGPK